MRRLPVLIAVLVVLAAPAGARARAVPHAWLGVVADGPMVTPDYEGSDEWGLMASAGAESVRVGFSWAALQPAAGGPPDFSSTDPVVLAAARRGLDVLPVLQGTPAWAAVTFGDYSTPPRDPRALAPLLPALVGRYGPHGSLWAEHPDVRPHPIRAWQIWNEPNLASFWDQPDWPRGYVAMLKAAHAALHRADPGAKTVLAGLTNQSWLALRAIYRAGGRGSFDVLALNTYTARPRDVVRLVHLARGEMRGAHDRLRPVWLTELGWPASVGRLAVGQPFETTDAGQARRLSRALRLLVRVRRRLRIRRVYWYTWLSDEAGPNNVWDYAGLRRLRNGRVVSAPALAAFSAIAHKLEH